MKTAYDMVVIGDINLDWHVRERLSIPFTELTDNGVILWGEIEELPGGSGLNFARFARQVGYTPLLLGKVGDDPAGHFVRKWLQVHQLASGVGVDPSVSTGKAFIVRDKSDIRFLVNNATNANHTFSIFDIEQHVDIITTCRVLYVSGYSVMDPLSPRTSATLKAMQLAHSSGHTTVIFDVVPHRFYQIYQFPQFRELTCNVDILISETSTIRRFFNQGDHNETVTHAEAEEAAKHLADYFDRFILRFGPSGCDEQVIWNTSNQQLQWERTDHSGVQDKRGFGDVLTLKTLKDVFMIEPMAKNT